jgi:hypothetical protein
MGSTHSWNSGNGSGIGGGAATSATPKWETLA